MARPSSGNARSAGSLRPSRSTRSSRAPSPPRDVPKATFEGQGLPASKASGRATDGGPIPDYVPAKEAASYLGVKPATLYAYTSRGQVRSIPGPQGRSRRYLLADLERLRARHDARAGHGAVAASALRWGEPVLDTHITFITPEGPFYRGHGAVALARANPPFEQVAEGLWGRELGDVPPWPAPLPLVRSKKWETAPPLLRLAAPIPQWALLDASPWNRSPEAERHRARRLLQSLARSLAPPSLDDPQGGPMALAVARSLGLGPRPPQRAVAALNGALILVADHELNPSTFAARLVASTGADLYAIVGAALYALSGPAHGGACDRIEALLDEAQGPERAEATVAARYRRGESVPGFSHRLYPDGDPRTLPLLEDAERLGGRRKNVATLLALVKAMARGPGEKPTVDLGLVALLLALGAPRGHASAVFAIGRTAGWVAHAWEQRDQGTLIRPRARYGGPGTPSPLGVP